MPVSRFIAILLVAAGTLLHLVLARQCGEFPSWSSLVYCGFSCGQLTILATWLGCGQGQLALRVSALSLAGVVTARVMAGASQAEFAQFFWFCLLICCHVAIPLTWLRRQGLVLRREGPESQRDRLRRGQVSLANLFGWATITAIVCGGARWMDVPWHHVWPVMGYAAAVSAAGMAGLWAVFGAVRYRWRLLGGLGVTLAAAGGLAIFAVQSQPYHEARSIAIVCCITFLTAGGISLAIAASGVSLRGRGVLCQIRCFASLDS